MSIFAKGKRNQHNSEPTYLRRLITPRSRGFTRSADCLFACPPPLTSSLTFSDRSLRNAAPHLWNNVPPSLRSCPLCNSIPIALSFPQLALSCLKFLSRLKTHLFTLSYPPPPFFLRPIIGCCCRIGRGASLYRHRSQLFERLWVRLSPPTGQFSEI